MKKSISRILSTLTIMSSAALATAYAAPVVFWQDNFETSAPSLGSATRVVAPAPTSLGFHGPDGTQCGPGDYFVRTGDAGGGTLHSDGFQAVFSNIQGSSYWRAEDLDGNPPPCDGSPHTITWSGINIAGLTGLRFSGYFAAFDSTADGYDPWEHTDGIKLEAKIGAGSYETILEFGGEAASKDVLRQEIPPTGTALSHALSKFSDILIAGTGTTLELKLTVYSNGGVEEIAFDHFELTSEVAQSPEIDITGLGTSIADGDATPDASDDTDFGAVALAGGSNSNTFTIHNTGSGILTLINSGSPPAFVNVTGAHKDDFTVTAQPPQSEVGPGATTTFDIKFDPTAAGLREAVVSIVNIDTDENPYTFAIQGWSGSEIAIVGNGTPISDGDTTPSTADNTDFGAVDTAAGVISKSFNIENTGADDLTLSGAPLVALGGTDAADFTVTLDPSTPVSGGGSTIFTVAFDPSENGVREATVTIANDDSDENPYTFNIRGTGQGVTFWTDDFETGSPTMGARSPSDGVHCSAGDYFERTNNAGEGIPGGVLGYQAVFSNIQGAYYWRAEDADPCTVPVLSWTGIDISGKDELHFSGYFGSQTTSAGVWEAVDGLLLQASIDGGGYTNLLEFRGNAAGTGLEQVVMGVPTGVTLDEALKTFSAPLGGAGTTLSLQLIVVSDGGQEELAFDHFTLESDTPAATEIEVTGAGTEIVSGDMTPDVLDDTDFGNIALAGSSTHTFTVSNLGGAALSLTGGPLPLVGIGGAHAGDFTLAVSPAASVPVSGSTSFDIQFTPSGTGLRTATIEIANDDADENPYIFAIQGSSVAEIEVTGNGEIIVNGSSSASSHNNSFFGETPAGTGSITRMFTVTNNGANDLALTPAPTALVTISGPGSSDFTVSSDATTPIGSGVSTDFEISFNPLSAGTKSAIVTIANDDPDDDPFTFAIEGIARGEVFWTDDFEGALSSTGVPRWANNHSDLVNGTHCATGDYFMRADDPGPDASLGYQYEFTNIEGSYYWRAEDLDNCIANPDLVEWQNIDITGKTNLHFNGHFAAGTGITGAWDAPDGMVVQYSIDGSPLQTLLDFSRKGGVNATHLALDGTGREIDEAFSAFHAPIIGTGSSLLLRIGVRSDGGAEEMGFDNFTLEADPPEMDVSGNGNPIVDGSITPSLTDHTDFTIVQIGDSLSRTYQIDNNGVGELILTGSPIVDVSGLAAGDFIVTQPVSSTIDAGGTTTFSIEFSPTAVGERLATVSIDNNDPDENPYDFDIKGMAIPPEVDLSITKTDGVASAAPGDSLTYTIVASNAGPADDPSVTLSDSFPAELTCTYISVAAGGASSNTPSGAGDLSETLSMPAFSSVTYAVACVIDSDATGTLSNTATITASVTDTVPANNSATDSDTVLVPEADLSVSKDDGVSAAIPGQDALVYTIVAANNGPSDDPAVSLSDAFPAALSCSYTSVAGNGASGNTAAGSTDLDETLSMPAGSSVTYTVNCPVGPELTGTLSNTASVAASVTDPDDTNDSATDSNTVLTPQADLQITKTDGVVTAVPGQDVLTYTIVASNDGPSADPSVDVTDTFPAVLSCTYTSIAAGGASGHTVAGSGDLAETLSMPAGSSVIYTANCDIDSSATGTLSNTASILASVTETDIGNDSATDADTVMTPEVDLSISKDDGVTTAIPGQDTLTYTIVASNGGPSDDPLVSVTDIFPAALSCSYTSVAVGGAEDNTLVGSGDLNEILSMPVGSSVTYTVSCDIDPSATGTLSNTVTILASVTETDPGNDSATDNDTILTPEADLQLSIIDDVDPVVTGNALTYTVTVNNGGPSDATGVSVSSILPTGVALISSTGCAEDPAGVPSCALGTIVAGGSDQLDIAVTIDPTTKGLITMAADVSAATADPDAGNDSATEDTVVNAVPPLFSLQFVPDAIEFTDTSVLTYTIDNTVSSIDASLLDFTNSLPANVVVATPPGILNTCTGGTVSAIPAGTLISYTGGSVPALSVCTISVTVTSAINGEYENITGDLTSDNGSSGTAAATLTVTGDLDGDMVHDDFDNCRVIANADQADFEGDGKGDLCDPDDDNDGMPDIWEAAFGLDPRSSWDRGEDPDGDGFTNVEEFEHRTDPFVYDEDLNNNGIPDVTEARGPKLLPIIMFQLLLGSD